MADPSERPGELDPTLAVGEASTIASGPGARGEPGAAATGATTGARLGRYVLGARLGAGAMGVVWAARDPSLDRPVAIKVVHPAFARAPDAAARLLREARAMAKVSHRAVVAVHDAGEADGQLFLAMELVEGTTLGRMMAERRAAELADWRRWLALLAEAGRGLAAAHAVGIVHRDFKPDNVLVARSGRVCVGDFGVAELSAAPRQGADLAPAASGTGLVLDDLTTTGALVGTPAYMSPEQLRGRAADARSDQFAFCVALHEALFGARPFPLPPPGARALDELLETVEGGRVAPPPRDSRVPRRIRDAVLRGLAARPDDRWPDMPSLLAALAPGRGRRPWLVAGAAAAVAVAGLVGALALGGGGARGTSPPGRGPSSGAELVAQARVPVPMHPMVALSPDGARLAIASAERLVVRATDGTGMWPFTHLDGKPIGNVEFVDADHLQLSRFGGAGEVVTWELSTDRLVATRPLPPRTKWLGAVQGGDLLMRDLADGGVELLVGDAAAQRRLAVARRPIEVLAVAPDRARFAYVDSEAHGGRPVVVDVATGGAVRGEPVVELGGLTWRDDRHLWLATGTTIDPAVSEVEVLADHLGAPRRRYHQDRGWLGPIVAASGRAFVVDSANSFRAKLTSRGGAIQDLDPELVGAALAWLDDGRWLGWNRTTGDLAPSDDRPGERVHAGIDGEPGNATRAGDVAIVAMRKPGGREVVAVALAEATRRWTLPVGTVALVRCAGDARPPCVAVVQPDGADARVHAIDLATGALGAELAHARAIEDVAVSPDGARLLLCDGSPTLRELALADGAERALTLPMTTTRGVAYDPTGGYLVAGTRAPRTYVVLQVDGARQVVLAQSDNEILFLPRASPDGRQVLVMGRLFMPQLLELREP